MVNIQFELEELEDRVAPSLTGPRTIVGNGDQDLEDCLAIEFW